MTMTEGNDGANTPLRQRRNIDRTIEIRKSYNGNSGFSIVGGKMDTTTSNDEAETRGSSGVFIKCIFSDASVADVGDLKVGDRILEVNSINVEDLSIDEVAELIQKSSNIIRLRVHSFTSKDKWLGNGETRSQLNDCRSNDDYNGNDFGRDTIGNLISSVETPAFENRTEINAVPDERFKEGNEEDAPHSENSSDSEDERYLEGNIYTKAGVEISRRSAGNVKRSPEELINDPEAEDEFGYTNQKVKKKYRHFGNQVLLTKIEKTSGDLGIALAGHKDRSVMATFICGLNPRGLAYKTGAFQVGDEILEVNGRVLHGKSHLNASVIIKSLPGPVYKIILHRGLTDKNDSAVLPLTHFPRVIDESDRYGEFEGVRTVSIKKGLYGLGIMIVEGKHADVGQGIFISDIQIGSAAEKGGLEVGDMILGVNADSLVGATYDQATAVLKRVEGIVTVSVCNPNQSKQKEQLMSTQPASAISDGQQTKQFSNQNVKNDGQDARTPATTPSTVPEVKKLEPMKPLTMEMTKNKDEVLGLVVIGGSDTCHGGVFILDIYPDSAAGKLDLLRGDLIQEFCQENFKVVDCDRAQTMIHSASGAIKMTVMRNDLFREEIEIELSKKMGRGIGLGLAGFKNGEGVYVSEVVSGGSAADSGKLEIGDIIIALNDQEVSTIPTNDIANIMKSVNSVKLNVRRYKVTT